MTPANEQELALVVKDAAANGTRLRIQGGGTRQALGNPIAADAVLRTDNLSGVTLYEPGALTLVAKAGTPLSEVEAVLAKQGQQLPFEPMDHRELLGSCGNPTIGSVVACNISGPRRIQTGACRDSLIGVRFVDGTGTILRNGGRVMKNVTGYDLVKLLAGSYGTLGVLSEVAFKVLPKPESVAVVEILGLTTARAIEAMSSALNSPFDVSGAAHIEEGVAGGPVTLIRVEGFRKSVTYRAEQLTKRLQEFGEVSVQTDARQAQEAFEQVKNVKGFAGKQGDVWRLSVKPSDAPGYADQLSYAGLSPQLIFDWGGGLIWALVPEGTDVRAILPISGHASLVRGDTSPAFHPQTETLAKIETGLRQKFDPAGILNPGLMN